MPQLMDAVEEAIRESPEGLKPNAVMQRIHSHPERMTRDMLLELLAKGVVTLDWTGKLHLRTANTSATTSR